MFLLTPLLLLAGVNAPGAIGAQSAELKFAPKMGVELTRSFERQTQWKMDSLEITVDGVPTKSPDIKQRLLTDYRVEVQDQIASMGRGRPTNLVRKFTGIHFQRKLQLQDQAGQREVLEHGRSALLGKQVEFILKAGDEGWKRIAKDVAPEVLAGLAEDMDLRAFLPSKPVAVGDAWQVPTDAFRALHRPAGDLDLRIVEEAAGAPAEDSARAEAASFEPELVGSIQAKLVEFAQTDGRSEARVALRIDLRALEFESTQDKGSFGTEVETTRRQHHYKLQGQLIWNQDTNHLRSLALDGSVQLRERTTGEQAYIGENIKFERDGTFSGTASYRIHIE